ncbi:MAG: T9SS type A sorting domain-containing protein [Bacteroidia bacterium]
MKRIYNYFYPLLVLFVFQNLSIVRAQTTFQKVFTGAYDMDGLDVIPAQGGGYIITGMITNDIIDDMDIHIIKTDNNGDTEWTKTYGGNSPEYSFNILQATDASGYYIIGYTQSFGSGDYDTWLLKINNSGDTLWTKRYGSWGNDQGKEIIPTSDGNYILVGYSNSATYPDYQAYLIKINPAGNIIWNKYYGGSNMEIGNSVKQCPDGGYIMFGQTFSYGNGNGDAYLVKTNALGDTVWTKTYGGTQGDEGICVVANNDGTYVLCVRDSSTAGNDIDVQIIKTDATGGIIWDKNYGGDKKDTDKMIEPTTDGGYVVAAISRSFGWNLPNMWILKLNSDGDTLWTRTYGGQDNEHCYAVRETTDGGFIAVGKTESFSSADGIMFLKLNSQGQLGTVGIDKLYTDNIINIFPNPAEENITINFNSESPYSVLTVSNILGQIVHSEKIDQPGQHISKTINLKDKESGIYFLTLETTKQITKTRFILK